MFVCKDCYYLFEKPEVAVENHGLSEPPYERFLRCPKCKSDNFLRR